MITIIHFSENPYHRYHQFFSVKKFVTINAHFLENLQISLPSLPSFFFCKKVCYDKCSRFGKSSKHLTIMVTKTVNYSKIMQRGQCQLKKRNWKKGLFFVHFF